MVIREQYLKYLERITGLTAGGFVGILGQAATNSEQAFILGVAGVAVSKTLEKLTNEVSKRALGPQEEFRTGWVLYMVSQEVQRGIDEGKVIRNDGFFTQKSSGASSDAVEVIESIVLRCQREAVEKKIPYFASLFASIAFDVSISAELAHQIPLQTNLVIASSAF